jgi:hypothetical protein
MAFFGSTLYLCAYYDVAANYIYSSQHEQYMSKLTTRSIRERQKVRFSRSQMRVTVVIYQRTRLKQGATGP